MKKIITLLLLIFIFNNQSKSQTDAGLGIYHYKGTKSYQIKDANGNPLIISSPVKKNRIYYTL